MDIENQFQEMDVSGKEEEGLPVESSGKATEGGRIDLCLVGRFITNKKINSTANDAIQDVRDLETYGWSPHQRSCGW